MNFGTLIKTRRIQMGLSQMELAALTGVSLPTIQHIERHQGNPSLQTIGALASELGIKVDFVYQDVDWSYLFQAGIPLVDKTDLNQTDEVKTLTRTMRELRKLLYRELDHREMKAVAALLLAMDTHFPSIAQRVISRKLRAKFKRFYTDPETVKLKRIATEKLAEYL